MPACYRLVLFTTLAAMTPIASAAADSFLQTSHHNIVDANGHTVHLKGFNLGGWLVMEPFFSPIAADRDAARAPIYTDEYSARRALATRFGESRERELFNAYQDAWVTQADLHRIADAGFNVVRVPLWWGQFFTLPKDSSGNPSPADFDTAALDRLERFVANARSAGLYVVLDLHGAVGSQSPAANTGQRSINRYWTDARAQEMTAWLWNAVAKRFKSNPGVAGYDLLNEPDARASKTEPWTKQDVAAVLQAYRSLYNTVRAADSDHIVFIEGTFKTWNWSALPNPSDEGWQNVVYEFHHYPIDANGQRIISINAINAKTDAAIADYQAHANYDVPGFVGEFNPQQTDPEPWRHAIEQYNQAGLSWAVWTYKSINGSVGRDYWGWYAVDTWRMRPKLDEDSFEQIQHKWTAWTTEAHFAPNSGLGINPGTSTRMVKKRTP
ncbi:glycoside hydrolase family 5 protein [Pseudomonas cerasi]|uniref:Cellulase n=1 Tax=Pseudomonas cerasi TaxID=1583341 RepID=A0A193STJ3_9PSED|nr:cellulase family glycosylhydrolase [Pseudomonas cerasi]CZT30148.1 cellulase [Pseudomonas cerasi]SOS21869.1 cellulase [Pseudomonas cerasi]